MVQNYPLNILHSTATMYSQCVAGVGSGDAALSLALFVDSTLRYNIIYVLGKCTHTTDRIYELT